MEQKEKPKKESYNKINRRTIKVLGVTIFQNIVTLYENPSTIEYSLFLEKFWEVKEKKDELDSK